MALLRLFDPTTQFQVKSGALNTSGKLKVFLNGTDDYAIVRDDYGTEIAQPVILDNNGRSQGLLVDGNRLYRLEVYDRFDTLLFTVPNMAPISGAGGTSGAITSSDGSIIVTDNGGRYDLSVADGEPDAWISANSAEYSYRTTDGTFGLVEGDKAGDAFEVVDHVLYIRKTGWYHVAADFSATKNSALANTFDDITFTICGENHRVTLDMTRTDDRSFGAYASDFRFSAGDAVTIAVSGISQGATAVLDRLAVHRIANAINGEDAGVYTGGEGITVDNINFEISIDPTVVQEKLTAGDNIVISDNVISATAEPQEQADWNQSDSSEVDYIKNKPDISGMISTALSDYTPTASLASVALSGDYDDLLDKPDLSVYATTSDLTTGLAGKQDTISDLSDIRSGAALGATAVQPAALNDYATTTDLTNGLAGKQDTLTAGSNITISNNVISASAAPQEQADWAETDNTKVDYIKNKPANLVQDANYVHTDNNFTNADATKLSGIATGAEVNVQANWNETDTSSDAYIQNKPTIPRPLSAGAGIAITDDVVSVKLADSSIASDSNGLSVTYPVPDPNYAPPENVLTIRGGHMIWAQQKVTDVEVNGNSVVDSSGLAQITVPSVPDTKELVAGANITITEGANNITIAATAAAQQVQANWNETDNTDPSYIQNKPTIPAAQVNSDWNAGSGVAQILNKPTLATVATSGDYDDLTNKPTIPAAQVNSDWNAVSGVAQILNKPTLANVATSGDYTDLTNTPSIPTIGTITI